MVWNWRTRGSHHRIARPSGRGVLVIKIEGHDSTLPYIMYAAISPRYFLVVPPRPGPLTRQPLLRTLQSLVLNTTYQIYQKRGPKSRLHLAEHRRENTGRHVGPRDTEAPQNVCRKAGPTSSAPILFTFLRRSLAYFALHPLKHGNRSIYIV